MTKKHEELVEELAIRFLDRYAASHEYGVTHRMEEVRENARHIVAYVLSAVRDGLEIPGEVGRYPGHGFKADWALDMYAMYEATDYIALRPLTGTSQRDPVGDKEER